MSNDGLPIHVAYVMEATAGGSRKHLRYIVEALRRLGTSVDLLLSPSLADPDFEDDVSLYLRIGCHVELLPMQKRPHLQDIAVWRQLVRSLRERRPQIVHTHCAKAGLLGRLAARRTLPGAKLVHTPHSYYFEGFRSPRTLALAVQLERWLNRRTDLVFCISEAERRIIKQYRLAPEAKVVVGPNGLPASFQASLREREAVRADLGLRPDQVAVGVFARMVPKKGHLWLLEALRLLPAATLARLRVLLFGDGPMADTIRARIAELHLGECVHMLGYRPGIETWLPGIDLAVLPSFYEGLAYQLLEALAAGVPLIATSIPGNRFPFPDNPILYVTPNAADELAEMLACLVDSEADRARLGAAGKAWVETHFPFAQQVAMLTRSYRHLLGLDDASE